MLGHTSIIMTYFGSVGYFLLAMAMRFVIIKQVLIVFIVVLMNKEKDHSLGVGGLGCVVCFVV